MFGILDAVVMSAVLLGTALAAPLISVIGIEASLLLVGAIAPIGAIAWRVCCNGRSGTP